MHNLIFTTDEVRDMRWVSVCVCVCVYVSVGYEGGEGEHINHVYLSGRGVEISDETSFNSMLS